MRNLKGLILKTFLFQLVILLFAACSANEFNLSFQLPTDVNNTYRLVYHASSSKQSLIIETVVAVNGGKAKMTCATKNPCVVYLFTTSSQEPRLMFWAERGDKINITGDSNDPMKWQVDGNSINKEWSKWRISNYEVLSKGDVAKINRLVADYVKSHSGDELSALLLLTYYDRRADETGFMKLWETLSDRKRADEIAGTVLRSDFPELAEQPEKIRHIIGLRQREESDSTISRYDTLIASKHRGMLLYFTDRDSNGKEEGYDTLRSLAKRYSGDAKVLVAEISVESDSTYWVMNSARDTLRGVHRLWLPAGVLHPEMERLGVNRGDFYIVANEKGVQMYRGGSASEASKTLRKLARSPLQKKK